MNVGSTPPTIVAPSAGTAPQPLVQPAAETPPEKGAAFALPAEPKAGPALSNEQVKPAEPTTALRIEYNVDAGRFVYLNSDPHSGETVSQVPTEEALRRIAWLRAQLEARQTPDKA